VSGNLSSVSRIMARVYQAKEGPPSYAGQVASKGGL
jgi:hypothetical protein